MEMNLELRVQGLTASQFYQEATLNNPTQSWYTFMSPTWCDFWTIRKLSAPKYLLSPAYSGTLPLENHIIGFNIILILSFSFKMHASYQFIASSAPSLSFITCSSKMGPYPLNIFRCSWQHCKLHQQRMLERHCRRKGISVLAPLCLPGRLLQLPRLL